MGRLDKKLFRINDELAAVQRQRMLAVEELSFHRLLDDDASRDAVVSGSPLDRADARETAGDVARFETEIAALDRRREKLESKRAKLLKKL